MHATRRGLQSRSMHVYIMYHDEKSTFKALSMTSTDWEVGDGRYGRGENLSKKWMKDFYNVFYCNNILL